MPFAISRRHGPDVALRRVRQWNGFAEFLRLWIAAPREDVEVRRRIGGKGFVVGILRPEGPDETVPIDRDRALVNVATGRRDRNRLSRRGPQPELIATGGRRELFQILRGLLETFR